MIVISPTNIEWTSDDATQLRNFIESVTGKRWLEALAFYAPELLDGSAPNKALVAMGESKGYSSAIFRTLQLTKEDPNAKALPPNASPNYASLDDDEAWKEIDKSENDKPS